MISELFCYGMFFFPPWAERKRDFFKKKKNTQLKRSFCGNHGLIVRQVINRRCQGLPNLQPALPAMQERGGEHQSELTHTNQWWALWMSEKKNAYINHIKKRLFCSPLYNKQLKIHEKALKELNRVLCLCPGSSWIVFEILINTGKKRRKIIYRTVISKTVPARSKKFNWLLLCKTAHEYKTRNGQKQKLLTTDCL